MPNHSYEDFLYVDDQLFHSLYEVQKEYEQNKGDISKYRDKMLCPECRRARLRFTHKTSERRAFLSTLPTSYHEEGCSYNYDLASNRAVKQFVATLTEEQVHDRLEAMLNKMLPRNIGDDENAVNAEQQTPFVIDIGARNHQLNRRAISRKSMNRWFDKADENNIFLFYGKVRLSVEETKTKKGKRYRLIVKTKRGVEWIQKTRIFRGMAKDAIDENTTYDLAVMGHLEFYNILPQIVTESWTSILYREARRKEETIKYIL
ncbi:hypothetical protein LIR39_04590 [Streptococcus sp. MSK15_114]|uniref:hypothetical protein n=1 Tax=Streptococcus sp. MSK15_114 TaxID=2883191 RepID=UPI002235071A|nr:hypothetical protein [Streptococcus sp. MSK15_114]MCB5733056.1 hypothetical protein [Streptococcus sp. MSK15_114]